MESGLRKLKVVSTQVVKAGLITRTLDKRKHKNFKIIARGNEPNRNYMKVNVKLSLFRFGLVLKFWFRKLKNNKFQHLKRVFQYRVHTKNRNPFSRTFQGLFKDQIKFSRATYQECNFIDGI